MNDATSLPSHALHTYYEGVSDHSTTDAITIAMREAILDGVLGPSMWLREDELAAAFAASRTPVREALRRLADEGLAVKTAHHGTVVASLSLDDILALYVVRIDLEGLAARLATSRDPAGLADRLDEVQRRMSGLADDGDTAALVTANLEFHRVLRHAADNPYLERFLTQVEHAVRRVASSFNAPGRPHDVLAEHAAIIDAVRGGDADAAETAAKDHMRRAREVRLQAALAP